jgi:hypothetical protein
MCGEVNICVSIDETKRANGREVANIVIGIP